jgi:ankyrin repeat protein
MEERFIELCENGDLDGAQQCYQLNPNINIFLNIDISENAFRIACSKGHLEIAKWLLLVKPDINISANNGYAFRIACSEGHLEVTQWLHLVNPTIISISQSIYLFILVCEKGYLEMAKWLFQIYLYDIYYIERAFYRACRKRQLHVVQWFLQVSKETGQEYSHFAFINACKNGRLELAQWLQNLKPYLYVIEYDENGNITDYKIRSKEESNWQQRKYLVWLASNHCPEENKNNLLYKLPNDVSRMLIGFV